MAFETGEYAVTVESGQDVWRFHTDYASNRSDALYQAINAIDSDGQYLP